MAYLFFPTAILNTLKKAQNGLAALCMTALLTSAATPIAAQALPYLLRGDVAAYIDDLVLVHGLDRRWVEDTLSQAQYSEQAEKLSTPSLAPPWRANWNEYRSRHVTARRIQEGVAFARTHANALARAHTQWGVPADIITAVIGIETHYGRFTGSLRTLDVLVTLSFDYTRRANLYRKELLQFLLWCRDQGLDPTEPTGSYAGAIGLPQFMPSSIRRYAVDFDGDGHIDLSNSPTDAIGSVAAFLYAHGWTAGLPTLFNAQADPTLTHMLSGGIKAAYTWQETQARGVQIDGALDLSTEVLLLDLDTLGEDGQTYKEFRIGTTNAAAILHYNRSYFYAVSVIELAQAIRAQLAQ